MTSQQSPASDARIEADARSAVTGTKGLDSLRGSVDAGIASNTETQTGLEEVKTKVELGSIKDQLSSVFKDKESRTAIIGTVGMALLAYVLKPEEREEFEEDTREEMEELKASGVLTKKEEEDVEKYYKQVEKKEENEEGDKEKEEKEIIIKEPNVISSAKMRAINIHGINKGNRKKLEKKNISLDDSIYEIGSYGVIKSKHLKDFDTFKNRICNVFQPKLSDNPKQQIDNSAKALSYCAIGIYQILPIHHFKKLGLSVQGEKGLENMYKFILSKEMQKELNLKILTASARSLNGNIEAVAVNYYSGKGKSYLEYLKSGKQEKPKWMTRKQGKHRSIQYYSGKVRKYFAGFYGKNLEKVNPNNRNQMLALQKAIQKKETGYSSGKRAKAKTASIEIA